MPTAGAYHWAVVTLWKNTFACATSRPSGEVSLRCTRGLGAGPPGASTTSVPAAPGTGYGYTVIGSATPLAEYGMAWPPRVPGVGPNEVGTPVPPLVSIGMGPKENTFDLLGSLAGVLPHHGPGAGLAAFGSTSGSTGLGAAGFGDCSPWIWLN